MRLIDRLLDSNFHARIGDGAQTLPDTSYLQGLLDDAPVLVADSVPELLAPRATQFSLQDEFLFWTPTPGSLLFCEYRIPDWVCTEAERREKVGIRPAYAGILFRWQENHKRDHTANYARYREADAIYWAQHGEAITRLWQEHGLRAPEHYTPAQNQALTIRMLCRAIERDDQALIQRLESETLAILPTAGEGLLFLQADGEVSGPHICWQWQLDPDGEPANFVRGIPVHTKADLPQAQEQQQNRFMLDADFLLWLGLLSVTLLRSPDLILVTPDEPQVRLNAYRRALGKLPLRDYRTMDLGRLLETFTHEPRAGYRKSLAKLALADPPPWP